ncbi:ferritin [uncultured Williamsia sp.]|uniref:ferritin n=1 Tax=uncultured Williamsia sp. TaxID=259311 RepID=UPI00345A93B7
MSTALEADFNAQITLELESAVVYRQLAIEMDMRDLRGMATWLRRQAEEENRHAEKFIDHLTDRGNHAVIGTIPSPSVSVSSVLECFETARAHEERVSTAIRSLYRQSEATDDLDSRPLLTWFLTEQLEEEAKVDEIVGRVGMIAGDGPGLLRLDAEMSARSTGSADTDAR